MDDQNNTTLSSIGAELYANLARTEAVTDSLEDTLISTSIKAGLGIEPTMLGTMDSYKDAFMCTSIDTDGNRSNCPITFLQEMSAAIEQTRNDHRALRDSCADMEYIKEQSSSKQSITERYKGGYRKYTKHSNGMECISFGTPNNVTTKCYSPFMNVVLGDHRINLVNFMVQDSKVGVCLSVIAKGSSTDV
jgi:hypothetical protein